MTRRLISAVVGTVLLAVGGCGVPLDAHPRDVDDPRQPYRACAPRGGGTGTALGVPCANGSLATGPLTIAEYATLIEG